MCCFFLSLLDLCVRLIGVTHGPSTIPANISDTTAGCLNCNTKNKTKNGIRWRTIRKYDWGSELEVMGDGKVFAG